MPKTRKEKEAIKDRLSKLFQESVCTVFADYRGLTVPQADELRDKMHEAGVTYLVAKKTLLNLAAKEVGVELNAKQFPGMIGVAFGTEDEVAPAKALGDMSKTTDLKLVGGIFDGAVVSEEYVTSLSKLPGRQELYGMFVGTIAGPMSAFVRALDAVAKQKESAV